jgi:hypothetical protein
MEVSAQLHASVALHRRKEPPSGPQSRSGCDSEGRRFLHCPCWASNPCSTVRNSVTILTELRLLSNGYQGLFPGGKAAGA